uniref:Uncharacterized protein n=1 Tax=Bionectria ochroleuca TaxID=29856 RepID=A0A0B7K080_BIOOC
MGRPLVASPFLRELFSSARFPSGNLLGVLTALSSSSPASSPSSPNESVVAFFFRFFTFEEPFRPKLGRTTTGPSLSSSAFEARAEFAFSVSSLGGLNALRSPDWRKGLREFFDPNKGFDTSTIVPKDSMLPLSLDDVGWSPASSSSETLITRALRFAANKLIPCEIRKWNSGPWESSLFVAV